ncbi:MAG: LLM class F420-dependent oxidoreductase [Chloroflexota bacterium]
MRLGMMLGYSGATIQLPIEMVLEADRLGYYAVWTAEAYGSDCVTPLAWVGALTQRIHLGTAIMQMPARTPAMTAMTAITLDQLSGGRMLMGLGLSGPQVVEGWHGMPYGKPLGKTREYVQIMRTILARETPLVHQGDHYQIPFEGEGATGLGKPLKSILHGRADLPIYLASIGPKNVALTAEIADGWLPVFFAPQFYDKTFQAAIESGFAKASHKKSMAEFDIAPSVTVIMGDDVEACQAMIKPALALYVGGMGAKGKNFYNDLVSRYGFEDAAVKIQDLYLSGQKAEAIAAVPNELVDAVALCGPKARIKERLQLWEDSPVTTLNLSVHDVATVQAMAELVLDAHPNRTTSLPSQKSEVLSSAPVEQTNHTKSVEDKSMSEAFAAEAVFENIAKQLAENPSLASGLDAVFKFDITDGPNGESKSWVVDLKDGKNSISNDETAESDVTITVKDQDMVGLASGSLNPQMAFMQGKVKVTGNLMLATKLDKLLGNM